VPGVLWLIVVLLAALAVRHTSRSGPRGARAGEFRPSRP
jgi:hypothetical protein